MPNDIGALLRALLVGKDNRPDLPPAPMKADFNSPPPRGVKNDGRIPREKLDERGQTYDQYKASQGFPKFGKKQERGDVPLSRSTDIELKRRR